MYKTYTGQCFRLIQNFNFSFLTIHEKNHLIKDITFVHKLDYFTLVVMYLFDFLKRTKSENQAETQNETMGSSG